jgi:acyl-coenzyme A synthetase/AMP-(fatty) acid ligase
MSPVAFLGHRDLSAVVAWRGRTAILVSDFLRDVAAVADVLPERKYLVNFCSDRYRFAVGLAAALLRGQVSLLPPAQTPELLRSLSQGYSGLYALSDSAPVSEVVETVAYPAPRPGDVPGIEPPAFPAEQLAAIAFTSGSTGEPSPHPKSWGRLAMGAAGEAQCIGLNAASGIALVGTVPPQHMYGLESSVLLALCNGFALHAARPFYPADIRAVLEELPGERVLVTTPVHLRALMAEEHRLPPLRLILCATAPLSPAMAAQAEASYGAPLHEIYGFTEAGMVASRRTTQGQRWHAMPGVRLWRTDKGVRVGGGHVPSEVGFTDLVELEDAHTFLLQGRSADLVNIAGKRTSLAYLNQQLGAIEGVEDGVFFMPEETADGVTRLMAFVVAPTLSRDALLSALRSRIDAAFLPRPLHIVAALPRNATGKLTREALVRLARSCDARGGGT